MMQFFQFGAGIVVITTIMSIFLKSFQPRDFDEAKEIILPLRVALIIWAAISLYLTLGH